MIHAYLDFAPGTRVWLVLAGFDCKQRTASVYAFRSEGSSVDLLDYLVKLPNPGEWRLTILFGQQRFQDYMAVGSPG